MNDASHPARESFVRVLLDGRIDFSALEPYPNLSHGRVQQVNDLLSRLRLDESEKVGVEHLKAWDILHKPTAWPTPLLVRLMRQVGSTDVSAALSLIAHLALGVRLIRSFGSEAQLRAYEETKEPLCAFALTEESPGSDVSRIQTYAEPSEDGFVLSGTKHWVTNAQWATHFLVVARTAPPRATDKPRLTTFLVRSQPGIEIKPVNTDVLPGSGVAQVTFHQVRLTKKDVLGTAGKGFRVVMSGLSEARLLVGAAVLGACIKSFNDTVERVSERRAFGRSVGNFPSVQDRIASMLGDILALESLVHGVGGLSEPGDPVDPVERGVVRLAVSRGAARVLDAARELHGASAFAGDAAAARHAAAARALTLLDGSDLALESFVVLEGTREVRRRLSRLTDASDVLSRVDAAASLFVDRAKSRFRKVAARSVPGVRVEELHAYAEQLGEHVDAAIRKHGVELVEKQHLHSRVARLTVELATWSALSARVKYEISSAGEVGARRMIEGACVWVSAAESRVKALLAELAENNDSEKDAIARRAYADATYPFDIF